MDDAIFAESWRDLQRRLRRMLVARGVPHDLVEDVLQDTAVKLWQSLDRIDPDRPLWPFAKTVATNCAVDRLRQTSPVYFEDVPDRPTDDDVEERGLARARLSYVATAIARLRPTDQVLLLGEIGVEPRGGNSSASKMARKRARIRLVHILDHLGSAFGAVQVGAQRVAAWTHSQILAPDPQPIASALGAVAAVSLAVLSWVGTEADLSSPGSGGVSAARVRPIELLERPEPRGNAVAEAAVDRDGHASPTPSTGSGSGAVTTTGASAPTRVDHQEKPSSKEPDRTVVGPDEAHAEARKGEGYRSVRACSSYAESGITIYDGSQEEDDDEESPRCS